MFFHGRKKQMFAGKTYAFELQNHRFWAVKP